MVSRTRQYVKLYADRLSSRNIAGAAYHRSVFRIYIYIHTYICVLAFISYAFLLDDPYSDLNTNTPKYDGIFSLLLPIYTVAKICATIVDVFLNILPKISTLCS
jgi:hypothetical protein